MSLYPETETGEIVQLLPQHRARVKIPKRSNCQGCSHRSFCDPFGSEYMLLEVDNSLQARSGQKVEVIFKAEKQSKAIIILYLIPLFALLLGAVLGTVLNPLGNKDLSGSVFSIGFTGLAFVGIRYWSKRQSSSSPDNQARIVKIVH